MKNNKLNIFFKYHNYKIFQKICLKLKEINFTPSNFTYLSFNYILILSIFQLKILFL